MTDVFVLMLMAAAGATLGAAYLGLLWVSVQVLTRRKSTGAYLLLTALRGGLVLGALWLAVAFDIGAGGILAGLAGFVLLRLSVTRAANTHRAEDT